MISAGKKEGMDMMQSTGSQLDLLEDRLSNDLSNHICRQTSLCSAASIEDFPIYAENNSSSFLRSCCFYGSIFRKVEKMRLKDGSKIEIRSLVR